DMRPLGRRRSPHMTARMAAAGAVLLCLGGCSVQHSLHSLREAIAGVRDQFSAAQRRFAVAVSYRAARIAAQDVAKPWLAGRAQPLARDVVLPPALRGDIDTTLLFAGRLDLSSLAERLARATGIAVRVAPDALLPQALFLPRLAQAAPSD